MSSSKKMYLTRMKCSFNYYILHMQTIERERERERAGEGYEEEEGELVVAFHISLSSNKLY